MEFDYVVHATGEIDMATAPDLLNTIKKARREGAQSICVDLDDVAFLDSSGIRVLIEGAQLFDADGGTFAIRQPQRAVRRVLEMSGVLETVIHEVAS